MTTYSFILYNEFNSLFATVCPVDITGQTVANEGAGGGSNPHCPYNISLFLCTMRTGAAMCFRNKKTGAYFKLFIFYPFLLYL